MSLKSSLVSVRLAPADADFLNGYQIDGAATPSEKLRAIIAEARERERGTQNYPSALRIAQDGIAPTLRIIRAAELDNGMHSELVSRLGEWLPDCAAFLVACNGDATNLTTEQLMEIEQGLASRVIVLVQSIMQMGLTAKGPCYDPGLLQDSLDPVLDLAQIILPHRAAKGGGK